MRAENFLPVFDEQKLIEDMKLSYKGKDTCNVRFKLCEPFTINTKFAVVLKLTSKIFTKVKKVTFS